MRKGEPAEEMCIAPATRIQVFIDEADTAVLRIYDGNGDYIRREVISSDPVVEVVAGILPGPSRFAVVYLKIDGTFYIRKGGLTGQKVWWAEEMTEEECWANQLWPRRN